MTDYRWGNALAQGSWLRVVLVDKLSFQAYYIPSDISTDTNHVTAIVAHGIMKGQELT